MIKKTSAYYQRKYRERLREQGLVKREVWVKPEHVGLLADIEKQLRDPLLLDKPSVGISQMSETQKWTNDTLLTALANSPLGDRISIEVVEGVEPALYIVMHDYGDLPLFATIVGDQIIVEAALWPADAIADKAAFNEVVLKTHKYFPLSTISLDTMSDGVDYYQMFGALSATSTLPNVVFEVETLADNVIQATSAYSEFLKPDAYA